MLIHKKTQKILVLENFWPYVNILMANVKINKEMPWLCLSIDSLFPLLLCEI